MDYNFILSCPFYPMAGCLGTIIFAVVAFEIAYNLLKLI
jgi:hypothetical protein